MAEPKMTAQDREWRAQMDAETLMRAESIKADGTRLTAAAKQARKIAREAEAVAKDKATQAARIPPKPPAPPPKPAAKPAAKPQGSAKRGK